MDQRKKRTLIVEGIDFLRVILICYLISTFVFQFIFTKADVIGKSMYPTLQEGEVVLSNTFKSLISDPDRFDIVSVKAPDNPGELWVKRVIGLPNEEVEFRDDKLYVNGKYIEEPFLDQVYVASQTMGKTLFTENYKIILKENEFLLVGDNRIVSHDSRAVGPFDRSQIVAEGFYVIYPFSEMKIVK